MRWYDRLLGRREAIVALRDSSGEVKMSAVGVFNRRGRNVRPILFPEWHGEPWHLDSRESLGNHRLRRHAVVEVVGAWADDNGQNED